MNLFPGAALRARIRQGSPVSRSGFTLIELIVVVLIIGIMAGIAVPTYNQTVEQGRAQEAVDLFISLRGAQARYLQKYGAYCFAVDFACPGFDVIPSALQNFNDPTVLAPGPGAGAPSWTLTLTRNIATPLYGAYTIKYDVEPNTGATFTCTGGTCQAFMPGPN